MGKDISMKVIMRSALFVLMKWVSAQLSNSKVVPVEVQAAFMPKKYGQLRLKTAG